MKNRLPLTFENVAVGKKALAKVPLVGRVHGIILEIGGTNSGNSADITYDNIVDDITVKVDDAVQRVHTALQLNQINSENGSNYAARVVDGTFASGGTDRTFLPIFFAKPWMVLARDQEQSAWTTDWMSRFQIEVNIKSGIANPYLDGLIIYDDIPDDQRNRPLIEKWIRSDLPAAGTTQTFPSYIAAKDIVSQLTLWDPTGASITRAKLKAGGAEVIDVSKNNTDAANQQFGLMAPASGRLTIPFDGSGLATDGLPAAIYKSLELKLDYSATASGTVTGILQRYGAPE